MYHKLINDKMLILAIITLISVTGFFIMRNQESETVSMDFVSVEGVDLIKVCKVAEVGFSKK